MAIAYDRLPLNALRVFEAVATRLSFADAAEALHVTPAAVSMQIKTLEDYLQVPLFRRSGRKVELTAEGEELLPGIRRGLDELEAALNQLRKDRKGGQINVSMLASFLQKWLLPRLPDLRDKHPDLELRIHTGRENVDFSRSDFHAAIRMGDGTWKGVHSEKILEEWLVVVASPALYEKYGPLGQSKIPENLPMLRGTELERADEPWVHWLEVGGNTPRPVRGSVLDDSVSVIAAAEQGLGYAMVRWSLAAEDLLAGKLKLASPVPLPYRWSYYFVCPKTYRSMPKIETFVGWLHTVAKAFPVPEGLTVTPGEPQRAPQPASPPPAALARKPAPVTAISKSRARGKA
ncbi:MAG TPA: LysR substrate-binding domain-containing protein [Steroidobacteraceae bacterium]|nr:LysR substrate-binding domain-containing protein [Steroidobacteraceae bacterium]